MKPRPQQRVRPETLALAQSRARATASLTTASGLSPEEQVYLLKAVCRHLWRLLDRRRGDGTPLTDDVYEMLCVDSKAAVDVTFEAMLTLHARDRIYVEPCRRILDQQLDRAFQYLLVYPDGDQRVVGEAELLMMAGLA